jgi:hypothetical protein
LLLLNNLLKNILSLQFGNVSLGWNFNAWARENGLTLTGTRICNANVLDMVKREPILGEKEEIKVEMIKLNESIASSTNTMDSFGAADENPIKINAEFETIDLKKEAEENASIEEDKAADGENGQQKNEMETMVSNIFASFPKCPIIFFIYKSIKLN